ncbi:uncharacterized protein [Procambarus clarkii]|uniref:uncharacterized protein n=1 Tax=Procambarus clarkii TaxID=6728 RepID=UPI0037421ED6
MPKHNNKQGRGASRTGSITPRALNETLATPQPSPMFVNTASAPPPHSPPSTHLGSLALEFTQSMAPCLNFKPLRSNPWLQKLHNLVKMQSEAILALQDTVTRQQHTIDRLLESSTNNNQEILNIQTVANGAMDQIRKIQAEETLSAQSDLLKKLEKQINLLQAHQAASEDDQEQQQLHDSLIISSTDLPVEQQGCAKFANKTLVLSSSATLGMVRFLRRKKLQEKVTGCQFPAVDFTLLLF